MRPRVDTPNSPSISKKLNNRCVRTIVALATAGGVLIVPGTSPDVVNAETSPANRVFDTRTERSTPLPSRARTCRQVAGLAGVPSGAEAVAVNITAVRNTQGGFVTAYALGSSRPNTSSLNFSGVNESRSNNAIVEVGDYGYICLYNYGSTHLILDVSGYFMANDYETVTPRRLGDTRQPGWVRPRPGQSVCFSTRGIVPPEGAAGVFVNVSAVRTKANGYLTVHGRDRTVPSTSTLNFQAGVNSASGTMAQLGSDGFICAYVIGTTDVIMDIVGYFKVGSSYDSLVTPFRAANTRNSGRLSAGRSVCFDVAGRGGVPWGAVQVFATVTLVNPSRNAFAVAYPFEYPVPSTSTVNAPARVNRSNGAWLQLGVEGRACVKASQSTDVIVDIWGLFNSTEVGGGSAFTPGALAWAPQKSSNTRPCNYRPGTGPIVRSGSLSPGDWVFAQQWKGTLPIATSANVMHYYKLYSHTRYVEYENCLNNVRMIERYHARPVTACAKLPFLYSIPVGLPSYWNYEANWTSNYLYRTDYRPCPNTLNRPR